MKKLIPLILLAVLILTSCGTAQNVSITTKNTEAPTVTTTKEGKSIFNYQGFIDLNFTTANNVSTVVIKNISPEDNKNGVSTLHKAAKSYFTPIDIKNIQTELTQGIKYDSIKYVSNDIVKTGESGTIKMQYLILDVSTDVKREDVKRKVTMSVELYNAKGKIISSKPIVITIP